MKPFLLSFSSVLLLTTTIGAQSPDAFSRLSDHFHHKTDSGITAGTALLVAQGDRLFTDFYGYQNVEKQIPVTDSTIFRLASMTKPVTSVAVMMLVEEGKLRLDDPVAKFIPAFGKMEVVGKDGKSEPLQRPLTIFDLLTHTSGISSEFDPSPAGKAVKKAFSEKQTTSLAELVEIVSHLPLAHQPGENWTYGLNTDVLAFIVEKVSGQAFGTFLRERIFTPLRMYDTDFRVPVEKISRLAAVYITGKDGRLALLEAPEKSYVASGRSFARGNGGLVSTIGDYYRFCQMLLGGGELDGIRLLRSETVHQMMQNHLPAHLGPYNAGLPPICHGFGFGFGVQTDKPVFGTPGDCAWPGSYMTYFFIDPTHGGIGILMTQLLDFSKLNLLAEFHTMASRVITENASVESGGK